MRSDIDRDEAINERWVDNLRAWALFLSLNFSSSTFQVWLSLHASSAGRHSRRFRKYFDWPWSEEFNTRGLMGNWCQISVASYWISIHKSGKNHRSSQSNEMLYIMMGQQGCQRMYLCSMRAHEYKKYYKTCDIFGHRRHIWPSATYLAIRVKYLGINELGMQVLIHLSLHGNFGRMHLCPFPRCAILL